MARLLLPVCPAPWACPEGDTFWSFIVKAENRSPRENFPVIMRSMTAAAIPFARSGFDVLLDFQSRRASSRRRVKILKEIRLDFVSLRPSIELCARRAAERSAGKIADYGPYRSFYGPLRTRVFR